MFNRLRNEFKAWYFSIFEWKREGFYEATMEILAKHKGDPVEALRDLFETGEYLTTDMQVLHRLHLLAFAEQNHFKIKVNLS